MKIGILRCKEVAVGCNAGKCKSSFGERSGSFDQYDSKEDELVKVLTCEGCGELSEEKLKAWISEFQSASVEIVHLSSCMRARCQQYKEYGQRLSESFGIIGYTHSTKKDDEIFTFSIK